MEWNPWSNFKNVDCRHGASWCNSYRNQGIQEFLWHPIFFRVIWDSSSLFLFFEVMGPSWRYNLTKKNNFSQEKNILSATALRPAFQRRIWFSLMTVNISFMFCDCNIVSSTYVIACFFLMKGSKYNVISRLMEIGSLEVHIDQRIHGCSCTFFQQWQKRLISVPPSWAEFDDKHKRDQLLRRTCYWPWPWSFALFLKISRSITELGYRASITNFT